MAKRKKAETETFADPGDFQTGSPGFEEYKFPFDVLDSTPGGSNLGRIEWHVEIFPARRRRDEERVRVREVRVWATQTRDPRYKGKCFRFETFAESLTHSHTRGRGFQPWRVQFCERHRGAVVYASYPEDHHRQLVVSPTSSISCEVYYE